MTDLKSLIDSTTPISSIHRGQAALGNLVIVGWVRTRRSVKKFSFVEVNDGSTSRSLQVIVDAVLPNYEHDILKLYTGASVRIEGELVESKGKEQKYELIARTVEVFGHADPESFPLQKKDMTFEYLRDVSYLRPRTSTFASVFRIRSRVSKAISDFFSSEGFYLVHTPLITAADCEGAGQMFQVTTLPLDNVPKTPAGQVDFDRDFFGTPTMLSVSGQLQGEAYALALGKIYTFGPAFRAEYSFTTRHLAELWMIEPEMSFHNLTDNINLAQAFLRYLVNDVLTHCEDDLVSIFEKTGFDTRPDLQSCLKNDFVRVSYTEAVDILLKSGKTFEFPVEWGCDLQSEHERYLCEQHFKSPVIVYNYPSGIKAFYMYLNDDQKTVRAMDVLVPGVGEVIGGSERETREDILTMRMKEVGVDPERMQWYLSLRRWGSAPHSGFGMGLDRFVMWVTGMHNVRDVIPFPRTAKNCIY